MEIIKEGNVREFSAAELWRNVCRNKIPRSPAQLMRCTAWAGSPWCKCGIISAVWNCTLGRTSPSCSHTAARVFFHPQLIINTTQLSDIRDTFITMSFRSNFLSALFSHRQCNYQVKENRGKKISFQTWSFPDEMTKLLKQCILFSSVRRYTLGLTAAFQQVFKWRDTVKSTPYRCSLAAGDFYMIILKLFVPTWKAGIVNFLAMFCKTNPAIPGIDCSVPYREKKKKEVKS